MITSKNYYDDIMSLNYDTIVIFSIYGRFAVMWKPDFGCMVHLSRNFINNEKKKKKTELKKSLTQLSHSYF